MKRRMKTTAGILAAAALCLTGCASEQQTSESKTEAAISTKESVAPSTEAAQTEEQVTLRFAWWGSDGRHEAILKAIEIYEEKNPNVKVEAEYSGYDGYYEKMMTTLASGTAPDLFQFMKAWVPDVQTANHYLADVSALPIDTSTLRDGLLEGSGNYKGEAVMIPVSVGGSAVYVNTDFAEKYSIDLSKEYTWEELKELGKSIHEQDADSYLLTADIDVLNYMFLEPYIVQLTGEVMFDEENYEVNFTKEQLQEAIQNIIDFYEAGAIEPFDESSVFVGQMNQNVKWINGQIGMLMDYTGSFSKYNESTNAPIDVMKIPQISDAKCSGVSFGGDRGVCINDTSANKEEAAKFLNFLLNDPDAINALGTNLGFCPTTVSEQTLVDSGVVNSIQVKATGLSSENAYTQNSLGANTSLLTLRKDVLQEVLYGDITVEEGAEEIFKDSKSILEDLKSNQ